MVAILGHCRWRLSVKGSSLSLKVVVIIYSVAQMSRPSGEANQLSCLKTRRCRRHAKRVDQRSWLI